MTRQPAKRRLAVIGVVLVAAVLAACGPGTVEIAYSPEKAAVYAYVIEVESTTTTKVSGQEDRSSSNTFTLRATHEVQSTDGEGSEVRVTLQAAGGEPRQLLVRLDRAAQLTEIVQVEGLPAEVL